VENAISHYVLVKTSASVLSWDPEPLSFLPLLSLFSFLFSPIATGLAGMPFDVAYVMESYRLQKDVN